MERGFQSKDDQAIVCILYITSVKIDQYERASSNSQASGDPNETDMRRGLITLRMCLSKITHACHVKKRGAWFS